MRHGVSLLSCQLVFPALLVIALSDAQSHIKSSYETYDRCCCMVFMELADLFGTR